MRRLVLLTVLATLALPAGQTGWAKETPPTPVWNGTTSVRDVKARLKAYFTADEDTRAATRAFLDDLGTLKASDVKKYAKTLLREMKKHGPKITHKSGQPFTFGKLTAPVFKSGKPKRKTPLLIALHGGGAGVGDGRNALQKWQGIGGKTFVLAPTAPELRATAWNHPDIEAWVLALIEAAKRSFDIDTNRIYIAGHSMGGFGSWSIGAHHADRFAALAPCAGGTFGRQIANLLNTPVYFFHSTDDKQVGPKSDQAAHRTLTKFKEQGYPYEWVYDEYDNIGHGLPPKGLKPIKDWLLEKKRNPYPKHVVWEPTRATKRRFFWLAQASNARIEGKITGNTVTLTGRGVRGAVVYLCKELLDVTKPVTIQANDEVVFEGLVAPRLSVLVDTIATNRDANQYYAYAVTLP